MHIITQSAIILQSCGWGSSNHRHIAIQGTESPEKSIQHIIEYITGSHLVEQIHASLKFQYIDTATHDEINIPFTFMNKKRSTHFTQACPQERMRQIGHSLLHTVQAIEL